MIGSHPQVYVEVCLFSTSPSSAAKRMTVPLHDKEIVSADRVSRQG
jgi:hypothetical protein